MKKITDFFVKRKMLSIILIVIIIGGIVFIGYNQFFKQSTNTNEIISIGQIRKQDLIKSISANGMVASKSNITVSSSINTAITKVVVEVGDKVSKGQTLATLNSKTLKSQYNQAWRNYKNALANQKLKVKQATTQVNELQLAYDNALVSALGDVNDPAVVAISKELAVAKNNLASVKLNDTVSSAYNSFIQAKSQLKSATIKAPITGTVTEVNASVGNLNSGNIFVIQDLDHLIIKASIADYDLGSVKKDLAIEVANSINSNKYSALVSLISPVVNSSGAFDIVATLSGDTTGLYVGQSVKLTIIEQEIKDVFVVAIDAVVRERDSKYIVGYNPETKVKTNITVSTGASNDYYIEVSGSGITDGLVYLLDPLNLLKINTSSGGNNLPFMGGGRVRVTQGESGGSTQGPQTTVGG